jgi:hypothetical protein
VTSLPNYSQNQATLQQSPDKLNTQLAVSYVELIAIYCEFFIFMINDNIKKIPHDLDQA